MTLSWSQSCNRELQRQRCKNLQRVAYFRKKISLLLYGRNLTQIRLFIRRKYFKTIAQFFSPNSA
jgi:hypothetical protein